MRLRGVILLLLALMTAAGAALLTRGWLQSQRVSVAAPAPQAPARVTTQVLVAKTDLSIGSFVRPEDLRWQAWPDATLAPGYVLQGTRPLEDFVGSVVRNSVTAGEPVTEAKVVTPGNSGFLAAVLSPGKRAISVPVNATSGISGFVFPGDHVDLILTHTLPKEIAGNDRRASETVLRDIRVLAIDQKVEGKAGEAVVARTATLEVTPKQGEMISVVVEMGKLSLMLRAMARDEIVEEQVEKQSGVTLDSDVSLLLPKPGRNRAGDGDDRQTVTLLRGSRGKGGGSSADVAVKPAPVTQ
ncbi:MAG: Flp pilus assembly protein CpaB [Alphaproteobacteria bacterium]|nr:Flp pilus assembly protein CpaB [Alphaproteobacteria bacterium]